MVAHIGVREDSHAALLGKPIRDRADLSGVAIFLKRPRTYRFGRPQDKVHCGARSERTRALPPFASIAKCAAIGALAFGEEIFLFGFTRHGRLFT